MSGKIVLVSGSFPPRVCGVADYVSRLADALRERGAAAEVWTGVGEAEAQPNKVLPVVSDWNRTGVRTLVADLVAARPSLVHLQWERGIYNQRPSVPVLLPLLLARAGIPLVTTFHALDGPCGWGKAHRSALLPLLALSRDIVVCSQRQLNAVRKFSLLAPKARLIPIGNVVPVLYPRHAERMPGPLQLIYFGFVWRGRNIETLLRALKAVQTLEGRENATLDIVGGVKDGDYLADLVHLATALGVIEQVNFRGALSFRDVSLALSQADIALLPYESGVSTGRTTLMAALAHELPIVTMGAPDNLSPLFEDGTNMCIAPVGNEAAFIKRVTELADDTNLQQELSGGALRLAEAFSWKSIAEQTLSLPTYLQVLPKSR